MHEKIKKFITIPNLRRVFQFSVILVMVLAPLSQIIRTFRQDPAPYTESPVYGNFILNSILGSIDHPLRNFLKIFYNDITGGPYSLKFYFLHLAEPLTAFVHTIVNLFHPSVWNVYMAFSFAIPLAIALLFGRIYCGYVCPMSAVVSSNIKFQKKFFNRKITRTSASPLRQPRFRMYFFYAVMGLSLAQPMILQYLIPPSLMQNASMDYVLFGGLTFWTALLLLVLSFEAAMPSYFCRNLCPTGLFLNLPGEMRLLKIDYVSGNRCLQDCTLCNDSCWLGLNPRGHADDPACDLCHRCVEICPQNRLTVGFRNKSAIRIHPGKTLSLCFILFAFLSHAGSLNADAEDVYVNPAFLSTLVESQTTAKSNTASGDANIYYSIVASKQFREGEYAFLHMHIQIKDEIYNGPILVEITSDEKIIEKRNLDTVNFPVSIQKSSIYRISFPFKKHENYTAKITSEQGTFHPSVIHFCYPIKRF